MPIELSALLDTEWAGALGWTLVHSLWQGALVAGLLACVLPLVPRRRAARRYALAVGALLLIPAMAVVTFWLQYAPAGGEVAFGESRMPGLPELLLPAAEAGSDWRPWLEARLPLVAMAWLIGCLFFGLRLTGGLGWLWWLRRQAVPMDARWQRRGAELARMAGLRRACLVAQSRQVRAPVAFGWLKPVVLLPVGLVNQLPPEAVEAILVHELMHIRRADFAVRLLQSLVEVAFYYHPAVWWLNALIDREREHACDDEVVRLLGDRISYARALMMAETLVAGKPALALGLKGRPSALWQRIQRMIDPSTQNPNIMEKTTAIVLLAAAMLLGAHWAQSRDEVPAPAWHPHEVLRDTVPQGKKQMKEVTHIVKVEDGRTIEIEMEGETITKVMVDGRPVPPDEYDQYRDEVEELRQEMAEPLHLDADTIITFFPEKDMRRTEIVVDEDFGPDTMIVFDWDFDTDTIVLEEGDQWEWEADDDPWPRRQRRMDLRMERLERELERMEEELERMFEGKDEEIRQRIEEALEETQRAMERLQQELPLPEDEDLDRLHEKIEREVEMARRKADVDRRRAEIELRRAERERRHAERKTWMEVLEHQLVQDGLIEPGASWSLELSDKKMKVNGKKMPEEVHQRYVELYERFHGTPSGKWKIEYRNEL